MSLAMGIASLESAPRRRPVASDMATPESCVLMLYTGGVEDPEFLAHDSDPCTTGAAALGSDGRAGRRGILRACPIEDPSGEAIRNPSGRQSGVSPAP